MIIEAAETCSRSPNLNSEQASAVYLYTDHYFPKLGIYSNPQHITFACLPVTRISLHAGTVIKARPSILADSELMTIVFIGLTNRFYQKNIIG